MPQFPQRRCPASLAGPSLAGLSLARLCVLGWIAVAVLVGALQAEDRGPVRMVRLPPTETVRSAQRSGGGETQLDALIQRILPGASGLLGTAQEEIPAPANDQQRFTVPLGPPPEPELDLLPSSSADLVTLTARNVPLSVVLSAIAKQHGLNLVSSEQVGLPISVNLTDVPLEDALYSILTVNGYTWHQHRNVLTVTPIAGGVPISPVVQGRELRVFTLSFLSAAEVDRVVKGLLSPIGQSFIAETDPQDKRKTREQLIVEDLPEYVQRIEEYIVQSDCPPRQVLIEARILEVDLDGRLTHGVNFEQLLRIGTGEVTLQTTGFADPMASPAFFLTVNGTDLNGLVEALQTTTDAKTLASPKVMVINGQEARIQIGEQLGFFVTTTTQTSTLQDVQFLDVGVVLTVTPLISNDGRILMSVKPEVSGGRINPDTTLPEEETTEVETTVMLHNGQGMVIGGLIKETDNELTTKVPWIGDFAWIGRAFQRRVVDRQRSEVIIALIPHIVPLPPGGEAQQQVELNRTSVPILAPPLKRVDRRIWEPELPDAVRNPIYPLHQLLHHHHPVPGAPTYLPANGPGNHTAPGPGARYTFPGPVPPGAVPPGPIPTGPIPQPVPGVQPRIERAPAT